MTTIIQVPPDYWESLAAVFAMFVAGSLFLQQTLALVFGWDVFVRLNEKQRDEHGVVYRTGVDLKPLIAAASALLVVYQFQFDAFAAIFQGDGSLFTLAATGIAFGGGSDFIHRVIKAYRGVRDAQADLRVEQAKAEAKRLQNGG